MGSFVSAGLAYTGSAVFGTLHLMDLLRSFAYLFLHLDVALSDVVARFGAWTYILLFAVVFCETGLVVAPFLPGDSLLFAVGALSAVDGIDVLSVYGVLFIAAILGDTANYWIGHELGVAFFNRPGKRQWIDPAHLEKARIFYAKHGGKAIVFARFVPIMRTIAPFVAGVAQMTYSKFVLYNLVGGFVWVTLFLFGGYFFGNIPFVKQNFTLVVMAIIAVSVTPGLLTWAKSLRKTTSIV